MLIVKLRTIDLSSSILNKQLLNWLLMYLELMWATCGPYTFNIISPPWSLKLLHIGTTTLTTKLHTLDPPLTHAGLTLQR